MTQTRPLNPALYAALKQVFGEVVLANAGLPFQAQAYIPAARPRVDGRAPFKKLNISSPGEYYCVRCPVCKDHKPRLWINHRWNTEFEGVRLRHLAKCYNEDCEQQSGFYDKLVALLGSGTRVAQIEAAQVQPPTELRWPGRCMRLDELPDQHIACAYMRSRGYDPKAIAATWGVSWCEYSTELPRHNRIVFPVWNYDDAGKLVYAGCQARYYNTTRGTDKPETRDEVKWFTQHGMRRSHILYNGWRALANRKLLVIAEGPLDVLKIGPEYAVALFGKSMAAAQAELIKRDWMSAGALIVLALDPDAHIAGNERESAVTRAYRLLAGYKDIYTLEFPNDKDPGDCTTEEIWEAITRLLAGRQ